MEIGSRWREPGTGAGRGSYQVRMKVSAVQGGQLWRGVEVKVTQRSEQTTHRVNQLAVRTDPGESQHCHVTLCQERETGAGALGQRDLKGAVLADTDSETWSEARGWLAAGEPSAALRGYPLCPSARRAATEKAAWPGSAVNADCPCRTPASHPVRNGEWGRAPKGEAQSSWLTGDVSLSSPESHKRQHGNLLCLPVSRLDACVPWRAAYE